MGEFICFMVVGLESYNLWFDVYVIYGNWYVGFIEFFLGDCFSFGIFFKKWFGNFRVRIIF